MKVEKVFFRIVWPLSFWFFLAIKLAGSALVAWSWWWVLLPPVPLIGILVKRWGL